MFQWPKAIETLFKHDFLSMSMAYPSGQPATIFWVCIFDPSKTISWQFLSMYFWPIQNHFLVFYMELGSRGPVVYKPGVSIARRRAPVATRTLRRMALMSCAAAPQLGKSASAPSHRPPPVMDTRRTAPCARGRTSAELRSVPGLGLRAKLRAVPLNPIFRPRFPKPCFPGPRPFKTGRGHIEMHLGCFLHRICIWKCAKPLHKRTNPNIWGFLTLWEIILPAPRGEHIFEKRTQNKNQSKYCKFKDSNELGAPRNLTRIKVNLQYLGLQAKQEYANTIPIL